MYAIHKEVKRVLRKSTREEYEKIVHLAFLTIREENILRMKKLDISNVDIAEELAVSVDTVNHALMAIYDKIARVI